MGRYRVRALCLECAEHWTTKAKKDAKPPRKCKACGSTKTIATSSWEINGTAV